MADRDMIDIHTHILPGMDDGSQTMEDSIRMAWMSVSSGVDTLIVTPHCNAEIVFDPDYGEQYRECFCELEEALREHRVPIRILPGMEVFGTEEVPNQIKQGRLISLNHSRYLMIEFGFYEDYELTLFLLQELVKLGYCPIIAHPERYPFVQQYPEIVYEWLELGSVIQVNKGSILGSFGYQARETAIDLLKQMLVSFVASDAHGPRRRTTDLYEINHFLRSNFSIEYADILLRENPRRVIENRVLAGLQRRVMS